MKLLIADDERIFIETIKKRIDWAALGIDTVLTAANGIEAYDVILDEYPDIVITDIKMPGLTGIELIQKIRKINPAVEFIILSGYSEFDYAREAMLYGVKHYLLKPCNEEEIRAALRDLMETLYEKNASARSARLPQLEDAILVNIISESVSADPLTPEGFSALLSPYRKFPGSENSSYEVCFFSRLEDEGAQYAYELIKSYFASRPQTPLFHVLYVSGTMLLLFRSFTLYYDRFDSYMTHIFLNGRMKTCKHERRHFDRLSDALWTIVSKIRRYDTIYYYRNDEKQAICNFRSIINQADSLIHQLFSKAQNPAALDSLLALLRQVTDVSLLKQLVSSAMLYAASKCLFFSSVNAADFLLEINGYDTAAEVFPAFRDKMTDLVNQYESAVKTPRKLSAEICSYVEDHLADDDLSLRQIAENYLFMNVDYVSKRFLKETGMKFSNYLTERRIEKAKELLANAETDTIYSVAELVGCGNNPQYFSQLFKKATGLTPSAYIRLVHSSPAAGNE